MRRRSAPTDARDVDRRWLEQLYRRYHHRRFVPPDPLQFLYGYDDVRDREVVGLIASSLAYGNVKAMLPAIERAIEPLGSSPARVLTQTAPRDLRRRYRGFRYRFTSDEQLSGLLLAVRVVIAQHGTLEACAASRGAGETTVLSSISALVETLAAAAPCSLIHLLPHPAAGSACKRLNLYFRWMVREDLVDPGGWRSFRPDQLVMPLDTHVFTTAHARGWTARRSADLKTALAVTSTLREISPDDPLRYDFAITRPGIRGPETPGPCHGAPMAGA